MRRATPPQMKAGLFGIFVNWVVGNPLVYMHTVSQNAHRVMIVLTAIEANTFQIKRPIQVSKHGHTHSV